jgi:hypothetical protein
LKIRAPSLNELPQMFRSRRGVFIQFRSKIFYQKFVTVDSAAPAARHILYILLRLRAPQAGQAMPAKLLFFFNRRAQFFF